MTQFALDDSSVVVVIGSGAGGGTISNELSQRGINVICLEAGKRLRMEDIVTDEAAMAPKINWTDRRVGSGDANPGFPVYSCKGVGGTTLHWTATALRMRAHELKARTTYGAIANSNLVDWPFELSELEPWYEAAEAKMGVTGTNDLPPLPENNNAKVLAAGGRALGYSQISTNRMAINSKPYDGRPGCIQLGFCKSGCRIGAKWSTLYTEIPKAEATGNFELRPESMAKRVLTDSNGEVSAVEYFDKDMNLVTQAAAAVVVACNAVDTPRLLLNSANAQYPNGLANSSDQLGRNYMRHMHMRVAGMMPAPVHHYKGTHQAGLIFDEMEHNPERGFVGGYNFATSVYPPAAFATGIYSDWGEALVARMDQYANLAAMIVMGEDLAEADNRISLHPTEKDQYGMPAPLVHYREHANTIAMRNHATVQSRKLYEALGAIEIWHVKGGSATHNMGTARMSNDPAAGVTDRFGRSHDIPNLFIGDGSLFPSSGAENPTLTIVALAMRLADHIASTDFA